MNNTENDMRRKFDEALFTIIQNKRIDNRAYLTQEEYNEQINLVKTSKETLKTSGAKKTIKDYRRVRKYDVITINGRERLIRPLEIATENVLYYVTNDELFDILHTTHSSIGHGGRNRMVSELKKKYCNITKESIMIYLSLCVHCQQKPGLKKRTVNKSAFNSRAQVDLIDMESKSYSGFRFIMIYQDHFTKFIILKPIKCKCAEEIAINLIDIYTTFGAPVVLHSNDGQEFMNSVLTEVHAMWNEIKIVHGKPILSQSQGIVERANIIEMLCTWMEQNQTQDWPMGLKFIQFKKNCALHSEIGRSPYEAIFRCSARYGLLSAGISHDEISNVHREEDIENMFNDPGEEREQHVSESEDEAELEPWYTETNELGNTSTEIPNVHREEDIGNLFNNPEEKSEQHQSESEAKLDAPCYTVTNEVDQEALQQNMNKDNVVKMHEQKEVPATQDDVEFITVKQEYDEDDCREPDPLVQCKIEHFSPKREPDELLTEQMKLEDGNYEELEEHVISEEQEDSSALGLPQEIIPINTDEGSNSNGDIQSCNICKIGFTDAKVLKKHIRSEHGVTEKISSFTCDICSKSFKTIHKLRKHLQVHTGEKPYTCEICKKCFTQNDNLQVHMRSHTGERPYVCQVCSHKFITKSALKVHYRVHSGERPYKCKICDKAFATSSYLAVHHRGHSVERPFKCEDCGKYFKTQQQRKKHKQFHLQKKPLYQCNLCDKTFKQKNSFTIHNKIGCESERLFRCSYCGKHTADRTGLVRHIRIHTGEKPYCCDICGTNYSDKTGLARHIRIHTGEKPYGCGICGARYSDKTALISHKRKHTDEKPYHCNICDMYFKSPNNLSRHRKKFHLANLSSTSAKHKEQMEIKLKAT